MVQFNIYCSHLCFYKSDNLFYSQYAYKQAIVPCIVVKAHTYAMLKWQGTPTCHLIWLIRHLCFVSFIGGLAYSWVLMLCINVLTLNLIPVLFVWYIYTSYHDLKPLVYLLGQIRVTFWLCHELGYVSSLTILS